MKMFNFSHWESVEENKGLLFFAQSMEEMLFHYGHDSLKVPALNFRFLCFETKSVIVKICDGILDKGNLQPLMKELSKSFSDDPVAKSLYGENFNSLFFTKDYKGEINRGFKVDSKNADLDVNVDKVGTVLDYLIADMDVDNKYYTTLKTMIISLIKKSCTMEDMGDIYQLTRILLVDLINFSYNQEFIYMVVMDVFFNSSKPVYSIEETLNSFFSFFNFETKSFTVIMPLKDRKLFQSLSNYKNLDIIIKHNRGDFFKGSCEWIIEFDGINTYDPYGARDIANTMLNFYISLIQYNNHKIKFLNPQYALVKLEGAEKTYNISPSLKPIQRGRTLSRSMASSKATSLLHTLPILRDKIMNAINLHSSAILSSDVGNQLINLWTIIEILIPIERKEAFSKINQICNVLTTVLNAQYTVSLVNQLHSDVQHCLPDYVDTILNTVEHAGNDIEKLTAILAFDKYGDKRNELMSQLDAYPLLQYRIYKYSTLLSDPKKYKDFLSAHRERLNWHIMRIYRSRNMYVHDGTLFPYKDIIIQNLHYYVDVLIDTINEYINNGYNSTNTIYTLLLQKEFHNLLELESNGERNEKWIRIILG